MDRVLSGDQCEQVRGLLRLFRRLTVGKRQDSAEEVVSETESGMSLLLKLFIAGSVSGSKGNRRWPREGRRGWEVVGSA